MAKTRTFANVMRVGAWVCGGLALGSVITCSPFGSGAFSCEGDSSCTGGDHGVCEVNGFCSFRDPQCDGTGQRYGDGPSAGRCVSGANPTIDAPIPTDAITMTDAMPGSEMIVPTRYCLGSFVKLCVPALPTNPVALPAAINTDTGGQCRTDVTDENNTPIATYCVIAAGSLSGSTIATGSRPLVLFAATDITITVLDVASHRTPATTTGPAANAALCVAPGTVKPTGGGGGGGFGTKGGDGGDGAPQTGGTGGAPSASTALRGGCPGKDGTAANTHGNGGGAVLLISGNTISVNGSINASGSSSSTAGTTNSAGASGAGSGGMIVFDNPVAITNAGAVFANGGGAAEGSGLGGNAGASGSDPSGIGAALGGAGQSDTGGDGGNGGAKPPGNGDGGRGSNGSGGGGGGGGGGVGVIKTHSNLPGNVSPPPTTF